MAVLETIDSGERSAPPADPEKAPSRQWPLDKLLITISTRLINLPSRAIDQALDEALEQVGLAVGREASLVFLLSEDRRNLVRRFGWVPPAKPGVAPPPEALRVSECPAMMRAVSGFEPYRLDRVVDLASDGSGEREHLVEAGIRSLLGIPIACRGELLGVLTLVSLSREHRWRDDEVDVLRVVGDIFAAALDRKGTEEALARANRRLEASNHELEAGNRRMRLLNELGDLLQSSGSCEEASVVIGDLLPRILEGTEGAAFVSQRESRRLEAVATWGADGVERPNLPAFPPEECWAVRRGKSHTVAPGATGMVCRHVLVADGRGYTCIPLMAQGEALGVLHVRGSREAGRPEPSLVASAAEHLALGLANLRLRAKLRSQALQDSLTGLFNRRYLEDRLEREIRRSRRRQTPLSVLMLDLDHFKRINDGFGHEAGDRLLQEVAAALAGSLRAEDVAARYGGEELTVLLPGTGLEEACWVGEKLRAAVRALRIRHGASTLPAITLSVGVASQPECGDHDGAELLRLADAALYEAKAEGRDRLVGAPGDPKVVPEVPRAVVHSPS